MRNSVNKNLFFLIILITIASVSASRKRQSKGDHLCGQTRGVLCVNETLTSIGTTARTIEQLARKIEESILGQNKISGRLAQFVDAEMKLIHRHLPPAEYYLRYPKLNNIDQEYLAHLLNEGHEAMSYYYNSLANVIETSDLAGLKIDPRLRDIKLSLRNMIICPFRSALAVYSLNWQLIDQAGRIQLSQEIYTHAPTIVSDAHSLIIVRLLHGWMERLHFFVDNLNTKFH